MICHAPADLPRRTGHGISPPSSREGLAPSPTCRPGKVVSATGMRPVRSSGKRLPATKRSIACASPPRATDGGFFVSRAFCRACGGADRRQVPGRNRRNRRLGGRRRRLRARPSQVRPPVRRASARQDPARRRRACPPPAGPSALLGQRLHLRHRRGAVFRYLEPAWRRTATNFGVCSPSFETPLRRLLRMRVRSLETP
jgi:hypothetical protein